MNISVPANVSIATAQLPQAYETAKAALAACASIDECQDWADKAAALASYAKQADDDTLEKMAMRIRARAIRRCGELLKQFDGRPGNAKQSAGDDTLISQRDVAEQAGMSKHQQVQAVRVANVPEEQFNTSVESDKPPTISQLAIMARNAAAAEPQKPAGFQQATHLLGAVRRFADFCRKNNPEAVAHGVMPSEIRETSEEVAVIDVWLDRFVVNLKG